MVEIDQTQEFSELALCRWLWEIPNDLHSFLHGLYALAAHMVSNSGTPKTHLLGLIMIPWSARRWNTNCRWCLCSSGLSLAIRRSPM